MEAFRVWAPNATSVDLVVDGEGRGPMRSLAGGWFEADVVPRAGMRYGFRLDGGEVLADPRSEWQPDGPHGRSAVVDHSAFHWTDTTWTGFQLPSAIIYELHIGTFTHEGTFDAAIERLPYLRDLGITAVEVLPIATFPGARGWGYDGVDLYAPHPAYGTPDAVKRFVDACHAHGLAVVLDVVYNHLGPDGNVLERYGPYFTDRYRTPWGKAVNYDGPGSNEVRRFVVDNARMWLDTYHFDALRLDAVHAIYDRSALHILEELHVEVAELSAHVRRDKYLIAESDLNDPRVVRSQEGGGYGIDAQWNDDFHHALHALLTGERSGYYADFGSLDDVAKSLADVFVFDGGYSTFRAARHGRPVGAVPRWRFVGYSQDHDQVGNRALGDRSSASLGTGRLKVAAALVLLGPFLPMLFQGEEWAASTPFAYFTDHADAELGRAVREGRAAEFAAFGWDAEQLPDPQARSTFVRSKLDWHEMEKPPHDEVLRWYRSLIALRSAEAAFTDGGDALGVVVEGEVLSLCRGAWRVTCNVGPAAWFQSDMEHWSLVLASCDEVRLAQGVLRLPPDGVAVLRQG